jgi:hypothetical protein
VSPGRLFGCRTVSSLEGYEQIVVTQHGVVLGKPRAKKRPPEAQIVQKKCLCRIAKKRVFDETSNESMNAQVIKQETLRVESTASNVSDIDKLLEVGNLFVSDAANRHPDNAAFDGFAGVIEIGDIHHGHRGNHGATSGEHSNEAVADEATDRFAHRHAANVQRGCE